MIHFQERRLLAYPIDCVYDLISNMEAYPSFVPWCQKCTIIERSSPHQLLCEMNVGFETIFTSYISHVTLTPQERVHVTGDSHVFHHLSTEWQLTSLGKNMTHVTFILSFQFKSDTLHFIAEKSFKKIAPRIMGAFEDEIKRNMSKRQN